MSLDSLDPRCSSHGRKDVEQELQELRLPVLGDIDGEIRAEQITSEPDRLQPRRELLLVELGEPGHGLACQCQDQNDGEEQAEPVLLEESPHAAASAAGTRMIIAAALP